MLFFFEIVLPIKYFSLTDTYNDTNITNVSGYTPVDVVILVIMVITVALDLLALFVSVFTIPIILFELIRDSSNAIYLELKEQEKEREVGKKKED